MTYPFDAVRPAAAPGGRESPAGLGNSLATWVGELNALAAMEAARRPWDLVGRAVVMFHKDRQFAIAMLRGVARDAGLAFREADGDEWMAAVRGGTYPEHSEPTLFFFPPGEWSAPLEGLSPSASELRDFQERLPRYLSAFPPEQRVIFATWAEEAGEISPALRSAGAFDRRFIFAAQAYEARGQRFLEGVGTEICETSLLSSPGKVGKLLDMEFDDPRREGLLGLAMRRLAYREGRRLRFQDLVRFGTYGTSDGDRLPTPSAATLARVALHEAGHVVVSVIDSAGRNIPEFASVIPGHRFRGVVADSYGYHQSLEDRMSYRESRHMIRSSLAGRAAEELVLGVEEAGAWGAHQDLLNATRWAGDLLGRCGFPENLELAGSCRANLAVVDKECSPFQEIRIERQVRHFLARQYEAVLAILKTHRELLERVAAVLQAERLLDQASIASLWAESGAPAASPVSSLAEV